MLLPFDAGALFTAIPRQVPSDVMHSRIHNWLSKEVIFRHKSDSFTIEEFPESLNLLAKNCVLYFQGKFYNLMQGASMD